MIGFFRVNYAEQLIEAKAELAALEQILSGATKINSYYIDKFLELKKKIALLEYRARLDKGE